MVLTVGLIWQQTAYAVRTVLYLGWFPGFSLMGLSEAFQTNKYYSAEMKRSPEEKS